MKTFLNSEQRTLLLRVLSILVVAATSIWVYSVLNQTNELKALGSQGIFLNSLLTITTVSLPAPGAAVVFVVACYGAFSEKW